ncbi:tRNA (N(6)-L-threonylcarbamoyladenosine(37)-C(2))-methylthiotransferase [Candidatus Woesearchaeota archaeon]|nr:tRNA (N(6)-L-threonylcarbamoyladenosine(37)-C(2))-methylthiotransferase [Candidatus Woesearchaeota archaeon]
MAKVFIQTYGCSFNQFDSEAMAGILSYHAHEIVQKPEEADVVIVNSCTVKNSAETKLFRDLRKFKDKKVIVAGCVPQAEQRYIDQQLKDYSIVGTFQIRHIAHAVEETINNNRVVLLQHEKEQRVNLPNIRRNSIVQIVPINDGCLSNCSFCKTKQARGNLFSYDPEAIQKRVEQAVKEGCKEIWLTSQDAAVYGLDIKTNLATLLQELVQIEGDFMIRVGMGNPTFFRKYIDDLIEIFQHPKIFKFFHCPVQAGNDAVLQDMNRGYTVDLFRKMVGKFQQAIPALTLSTDIIVGFPTETKEQFEDTTALVKEIKPDIINISRFWPRPGTRAAAMKLLQGSETKARSRILTELVEKIGFEKNQRWVGWEGKILIDEGGKNETMVGRNYAYKPVIVKGNYPLGTRINVRIEKATWYDLRAMMV